VRAICNFSLVPKILMIEVLAISIGAIPKSIHDFITANKFLEQKFNSNLHQIQHAVETGITNSLWDYSVEEANNVLNSAKENKNIIKIIVHDSNDKKFTEVENSNPQEINENDIIVLKSDVNYRDRVIGKVTYYYTEQELIDAKSSNLIHLLVSNFVAYAAILLTTFILLKFILIFLNENIINLKQII
jgi:cytochrome b involved in lipid metabolism